MFLCFHPCRKDDKADLDSPVIATPTTVEKLLPGGLAESGADFVRRNREEIATAMEHALRNQDNPRARYASSDVKAQGAFRLPRRDLLKQKVKFPLIDVQPSDVAGNYAAAIVMWRSLGGSLGVHVVCIM